MPLDASMIDSSEGDAVIAGAIIKHLTHRLDEGSLFQKLIRATDSFFAEGFVLLSYSKVVSEIPEARIRKIHIDWWYVALGTLKEALHNLREGNSTSSVTNASTILNFYITTLIYHSTEESCIPRDDTSIGYEWECRTEIK